MRYAIMDFNQVKLAELQQQDSSFDMNDVLILQYIKDALARTKGMIKIHDTNEQSYVWLAHSKIHEDLPFLNIKEDALKKRIRKLTELGLIKSKVIADNSGRGTRAYYTTTELFDSLIYDNDQVYSNTPENTTKCIKNTLVDRPGVLEYTSNSKLNIDSKLKDDNNTILKNSTAEPSLNNSLNNSEEKIKDTKPKRRIFLNDDFSNKSYNNEKEEKQQTKKLNLYEKCILEIDEYTTDAKLKDALKEYLNVRLKMKDKKLLGVGQWKALLKTLSTLNGDKVAIVERATERGWGAFFELKDYQYKSYNEPDRSIFGETDAMTNLRPHEVEGGESSGVIF